MKNNFSSHCLSMDNPVTARVLFLFFCFLCLALYRPNPDAGFVLDGHYVVAQNPVIKSPQLYSDILKDGLFEPYKSSPQVHFNYYRPAVLLSYIPDYRVWKLQAFGYRLTNTGIHFLNTLLVYLLIFLLLGDRKAAFLSSFFFCILPVHEWVVNYVVGRADLLQCVFSLLSLVTLIYYLRGQCVGWMVASKFAFFAALLSREAAILLPLYVWAAVFFHSQKLKKAFRIMYPYAGISLLYFLIRHFLFPILRPDSAQLFSPEGIFAGISQSFAYVFRFVVPWSFFYSLPGAEFQNIICAVAVLVLLALAAFTIKNPPDRGHFSVLAFGVIWVAAGMVPFFAAQGLITRLGPYLSEHFLYFPSIGFVLVLSFVILSLRSRLAQKIIIGLLSCYYVMIVVFNNSFWTGEEALLRRVKQTEAGLNTVASRQLLMKFDDDLDAVLQMIEQAQNPVVQSRWLQRVGHIYRVRGDYAAATGYFREAIELNPAHLDARNELAVSYLESGAWDEGIAELQASLRIDENYFETRRLLGEAFYRKGDFAGAVEQLKKAYENNPDNVQAVLYLAMAYFLKGDQENYGQYVDLAGQIHPHMVGVLQFIATELYLHGRFEDAIGLLERNRALVAGSGPLRTLLQQSYGRTGQNLEGSMQAF